jgi:hypothetical protein
MTPKGCKMAMVDGGGLDTCLQHATVHKYHLSDCWHWQQYKPVQPWERMSRLTVQLPDSQNCAEVFETHRKPLQEQHPRNPCKQMTQ